MSNQSTTTDRRQPRTRTPSPDWQVLEGIDPDTAEFRYSRVGDDRILVLRIGNGFRGVERSCPHQQRSLHDAFCRAATA